MSDQPWIYIVLLGAVIVIYSRMRMKRSDGKSTAAPSVKEMEDTLDHFAAELEQENEQLLEAVAQMKAETAIRTSALASKVDELEKRCYELAKEVNRLSVLAVQQQATLETAVRGVPVVVVEPAEQQEESISSMQLKVRYPTLFELHGQGKSVEMIAKRLGMNKGEVNLILQLARQEEEAGV